MFILNQFNIIQNLQMSPIAQTSFLVGTFFYSFIHQTGSKTCGLKTVDSFPKLIFILKKINNLTW